MESKPHIVVAGAGAVGCFVGGLLRSAGLNITLLARARISQELRAHGLTLTDFSGLAQKTDHEELTIVADPACLATADIILVCVKSGATAQIGRSIAQFAKPDAQIISLQNGTENADVLRGLLPDYDVRAGMVPFNVVPMGQGCFHRATSGDIVIGPGQGGLAQTLTVPHLTVIESVDITALQWGKFVINLNNALNALSGLTLKTQLQNRDWRRLMADQCAEALGVLQANGIKALSNTPGSTRLIPMVLRLPTPLFLLVARKMITIDDQARTSMAHDLMAGRHSEIDSLQGQVVRMGAKVGKPTPVNARVLDLMQLAESAAQGLPDLQVGAIRSTL